MMSREKQTPRAAWSGIAATTRRSSCRMRGPCAWPSGSLSSKSQTIIQKGRSLSDRPSFFLGLGCQSCRKFNNSLFRPKPLRAFPPRNKPAVPPMLRRRKFHPPILLHVRLQKRLVRHKRIILRRNHQHRHAHPPNDALRPCVLVIILRILVPELRRRDRVIKFPHRPNRSKSVPRISLWKTVRLPPVPRHQSLHKMPLVQVILRLLQRIRASR